VVTWDELAATLGPQSAPYLFDEEWWEGEPKLRSVACACGALLEIIDEGIGVAPGEFVCDACTLRFAFMHGDDLERGYWQWRLDGVLRRVLAARQEG
jgi:hypothetical protein